MATLTSGNVRQSAAVSRFSSGDESVAFGDFLRTGSRTPRAHASTDRARDKNSVSASRRARTRQPLGRAAGHLSTRRDQSLRAERRPRSERRPRRTRTSVASVATTKANATLCAAETRPPLEPRARRRHHRTVGAGSVSALLVDARDRQRPLSRSPRCGSTRQPARLPRQPLPRPHPPHQRSRNLRSTVPSPQAVVAVEAPLASIPSVEDGELTIVTEPAGARVTIDGMGRGTTPLTVAHLPFGLHRIRVTLDGYVGRATGRAIDASAPNANVQISLQAIP